MSKTPNTQSEKRHQESLASRFGAPGEETVLFLTSSSDVGVIRNGGRNGARLAPRSLLSHFKRLTLDQALSRVSFEVTEVSDEALEVKAFHEAQLLEGKQIDVAKKKFPRARIVHLGGGHDHVYPLLKSFSDKKRVVVLNLDAHADTRTDAESNSGTPFRQFAEEFPGEFHLFQLGLHVFANSESTLSPLSKGKMHVLWRKDLQNETAWNNFFAELGMLVDQDTVVIFSLDADALSGELVPGVSAVNGMGLKTEELFRAWHAYRGLPLAHPPVMGIYELNPVYDTLSGMSMRFMANFLYVTLKN